ELIKLLFERLTLRPLVSSRNEPSPQLGLNRQLLKCGDGRPRILRRNQDASRPVAECWANAADRRSHDWDARRLCLHQNLRDALGQRDVQEGVRLPVVSPELRTAWDIAHQLDSLANTELRRLPLKWLDERPRADHGEAPVP